MDKVTRDKRAKVIRLGLQVVRTARDIEGSRDIHNDHKILKELKAALAELPEEVPIDD